MNQKSERKTNGAATAALLIQIGIEQMTASPTLRKQVGLSLFDLQAAAKIKRKLAAESKLEC